MGSTPKSVARWIVTAGLLGLTVAADAHAGATYRIADGGSTVRFRSVGDDGPPDRVVVYEQRRVAPDHRQHRRPVVSTPRTAGPGTPGGAPVVYRIRDVASSGSSEGRVVAYEVRSLRPAQDGDVAPSRDGSGFDGLIDRAARSLRVEAALVKAMVAAESGFDPEAVSAKGAQGLMQLMPQTARGLGVRRPFHPEDNILGGTRYLRQMLDRYGDDVHLALAAYNAGPAVVDRYGGVPPYSETQNYVRRVLDLRERYLEPNGR